MATTSELAAAAVPATLIERLVGPPWPIPSTGMVSPLSQPLPRLRRKRRVDVPGLVGRFLPNIAEIDDQVEPWALAWDEQNAEALTESGPLWVVLGDSASQGIGANHWTEGWVTLVRRRLRDATGQPWRVINLAMSGGRFDNVLNDQLPVLRTHNLSPAMVTCVVGSNDLMWRRSTGPVVKDARELAEALPAGTLLSRLGGPGKRPRMVNEEWDRIAQTQGLHLYSIWSWPGATGALAVDRIHPSNLGYTYMADLAWAAMNDHQLVT